MRTKQAIKNLASGVVDCSDRIHEIRKQIGYAGALKCPNISVFELVQLIFEYLSVEVRVTPEKAELVKKGEADGHH